jgi:hypothetical protein
MEPKGSSPYSYQLATRPYPDPARSSLYLPIQPIEDTS